MQKCAHLVELGKSCKMRTYSQKSALRQLRGVGKGETRYGLKDRVGDTCMLVAVSSAKLYKMTRKNMGLAYALAEAFQLEALVLRYS